MQDALPKVSEEQKEKNKAYWTQFQVQSRASSSHAEALESEGGEGGESSGPDDDVVVEPRNLFPDKSPMSPHGPVEEEYEPSEDFSQETLCLSPVPKPYPKRESLVGENMPDMQVDDYPTDESTPTWQCFFMCLVFLGYIFGFGWCGNRHRP